MMTKAFSVFAGVAIGTLTYLGLEHERKQTPEYRKEQVTKEIKELESLRGYFYREQAKGRNVKRIIKGANFCLKEAREELRAI